MASLIRWDPFAEISSLRRTMDRVFDEFAGGLRPWRGEAAELAFPVDLYETDDTIVVKAMLPGLRPEDVDISVTTEGLTIKGEMKHEEKVERENYYRQEIP